MNKDKSLKHRVICPICNKAFDVRTGKIYPKTGKMICTPCYKKYTRFKLIDEY